MTEQDYHVAIGAYVLGGLEPDEVTELEGHIDGCAECQRELAEFTDTVARLALVPADLVGETLAQPPAREFPRAAVRPDDMLLQRTLRQVRTERAGARRRRVLAVAAGLAVLVAAPVITAIAVRGGNGPTTVAQPPSASAPAGQVVRASDAATGVSGVATLVSASWGTKLQARFTGEPRGEKCRLLVLSGSGEREVAASWAVTGAGTTVQGSVSIPRSEIARLVVQTYGGRTLLTMTT